MKNLPLITTFVLSRASDVVTTLINTTKWGNDGEMNPMNRYFLDNGLFVPAQAVMTLLFILLCSGTRFGRALMWGMIFTSFLVSILNLVTYLITL